MGNRPGKTPANNGRMKSGSGGSGLAGGLMAALGGGGMSGGPTANPGTTVGDGGDELDGGGGETLTPPSVSFTPYTPQHPVLDAIFNGGRGNAAANAANMGYQMNTAEGVNQLNNASVLQKAQQTFELTKQSIAHNNELDTAQKQAALNQASNEHAQNVAVLTSNNVLSTPANQQAWDSSVSQPAIGAAASRAVASGQASRVAGQRDAAVGDAQSGMLPTMVNTATANLARENVAAQGALANQPSVNAASASDSDYHPAMVRTALNKESLVPAGPLYNVNTRSLQYNPIAKQMEQAMMQNSGLLGGQTVSPYGGAGQINSSPKPVAPTSSPAPVTTQPQLTPPIVPQAQATPYGPPAPYNSNSPFLNTIMNGSTGYSNTNGYNSSSPFLNYLIDSLSKSKQQQQPQQGGF